MNNDNEDNDNEDNDNKDNDNEDNDNGNNKEGEDNKTTTITIKIRRCNKISFKVKGNKYWAAGIYY